MGGIINGRPTKTFFVNMITRDISIKDAILDLLDNSIDGASRINRDDYSGLTIKLTINSDEFILEDNCGGFSLDIAQKYAFRFGRPIDAAASGGTIGRFGVGMKRALFKMGDLFEVESKTEVDHFQVDVDVELWKAKTQLVKINDGVEEEVEDWSFDYVLISDDNLNLLESGTYIRVANLHTEVKAEFQDDAFLLSLEKDIENLLNFSLEKGIQISLNDKILERKAVEIFNESSQPYKFEFNENGIDFRIIAGLGETDVYCNDRLVLEASTDSNTGWGVGSVPRFTNDFAMFRGVVFLNSEDTIKLPLTTTKKGIDTTSEVYKRALQFMNEGSLQVITFLKDVRKLEQPREYRTQLGDHEKVRLNVINLKTAEINAERQFTRPPIDYDEISRKSDYVRIACYKERTIVDRVKEFNGAKTYTDLGSSIFDYYVEMEDLNNE
jgi:hypothetical protein